MDPTLLAHDLVVTEVAPRYQSALFVLLAGLARLSSLPFAYCAVFVACRVALLAAYHRFCVAVTGDRRAAAWATVLLTGFGFYGFGFYLGGVPLLEEKVVPRAAALPFAVLALALLIERRTLLAAAATLVAAVLHPVTGLATLGIGGVYELFELRASRARLPLVVWGALAALFAALGAAQGTFAMADGEVRVDGAWREIVHATVGPFVYASEDMAWTLPLFPTALAIGAAALFAAGTPTVRRVALRLAIATGLALALQLAGVDGLGIHALLLANPARASFALVACAGAALGLLVARRFESPSRSDRIAAGLLAACVLLRIDARVTLPLALACAALPTLRRITSRGLGAQRAELAAAALAGAVVVLGLASARERLATDLGAWLAGREVGWRAGRSYPPSFHGLRDLARLGLGDPAAIEAQHWIRAHSTPDETILPPLATPIGWQVHSERACVWNSSLGTFTLLSRSFALRYRDAMAPIGALQGASWRALADHARAEGASFAVADLRMSRPTRDDPQAVFTAGPWAVLRATPASPAGGPLP